VDQVRDELGSPEPDIVLAARECAGTGRRRIPPARQRKARNPRLRAAS